MLSSDSVVASTCKASAALVVILATAPAAHGAPEAATQAAAPAARADETRLEGRWDERPLGLNASAVWIHGQRRASVKREAEGPTTGGQIALERDLVYRQTRDVLQLRVDFRALRRLTLFAGVPLVIADRRSLDFDRDAACPTATSACVDERNATVLRDRILPGYGMSRFGQDAVHERPFQSPSGTVFRGPTRAGLEYLGLGASYALLRQEGHERTPSWLVALETRWAVGPAQGFDPTRPGANKAVGPGYHQFLFSTEFSRRFEMLAPYLGLWFMAPSGGSGPFERYADAAGGGSPQKRAGADFGLEAVAWQDPRTRRRLGLELRGRMELRFAGLAQSELWEPLSGAATCPKDPAACRGAVDRDVGGDGVPDANPGVTRSPAYGLFGADAGLSLLVGGTFRFRGLFGMTFEQSRLLTDTRSGNTVYDVPGRRFLVEDARSWRLFFDGGLLF